MKCWGCHESINLQENCSFSCLNYQRWQRRQFKRKRQNFLASFQNGLYFQSITLTLISDYFKCMKSSLAVPHAIISARAIIQPSVQPFMRNKACFDLSDFVPCKISHYFYFLWNLFNWNAICLTEYCGSAIAFDCKKFVPSYSVLYSMCAGMIPDIMLVL